MLKVVTDRPGLTADVRRVMAPRRRRTSRPASRSRRTPTPPSQQRPRPAGVLPRARGRTRSGWSSGTAATAEDLDYLRELMDAGATIGMDRFGMEHVLPDDAASRPCWRCCASGYADRMVLSHDAAFFSRVTPPSWRARHAPHWHHGEPPAPDRAAAARPAARPRSDLHQMLVANPARLLAPGHATEERMTMRTSIATVCLSGTLTEKLHACAEAGFDGVEIFEPDLVASPGEPRGDRRAGRAARADPRPLPAVPRRRGRHRGGVRRASCTAPERSSG